MIKENTPADTPVVWLSLVISLEFGVDTIVKKLDEYSYKAGPINVYSEANISYMHPFPLIPFIIPSNSVCIGFLLH